VLPDLPQMEFPESILGRRRRPPRRLVVVAAVVLAAVAAALIGVLVSTGSPSQRHVVLRMLVPPPTLRHPVPFGTKVSLAGAAAALGEPVALPNTPLAKSSGNGAVWLERVPRRVDDRRGHLPAFPSHRPLRAPRPVQGAAGGALHRHGEGEIRPPSARSRRRAGDRPIRTPTRPAGTSAPSSSWTIAS
jgi:hypothetical protein